MDVLLFIHWKQILIKRINAWEKIFMKNSILYISFLAVVVSFCPLFGMDSDMIMLLQKYLKIKTVYPSCNYDEVVALFQNQATEDGLESQLIRLPCGNPVLIITVLGTDPDLPALALNSHMDVVPADNASEWNYPPFAGIIENGIIYGRGAQDCKGVGVAQYGALRQIKQRNIQPARTIHLILMPDEERGGFEGAKEFIAHPIFDSLKIGFVLDEGIASGDEKELLIKIDERTPIQVRITSKGPQGHASGLFHENCVHTLIKMLKDVALFNTQQQELTQKTEAGKYASIHITSLTAPNGALNVIPPMAQATLDMRIPSSVSLENGIALIENFMNSYSGISYEVLMTSKERCSRVSLDSSFYEVVANVIARHGIVPRPFVFEATTDARFYSHRGIEAIGFSPFTDIPNLHGTNESIRVKDVEQGIALVYDFLDAFCMIRDNY